jgi:hypothetical protein
MSFEHLREKTDGDKYHVPLPPRPIPSYSLLWGEPGEGEHGDVVVLPEGLSGVCDRFGGLRGDRGCAFETVELAGFISCFHHSVGSQHQLFASSHFVY